jgi:hypothetical protein
VRGFREAYGAGPFHLLAVLATFGVAAYALSRSFDLLGDPARMLVWLGGGIVTHDLVLVPFYSLLGLIAAAALLRPSGRPTRLRIAALNHLRVPALLSGLLALVWFPLIAGKGSGSFSRATGLSNDVYLERWLLLTAALFMASAAVFALRARGLARRR